MTGVAEKMQAKASVFVLYTGGTIGMAPKNPEIPGSPLEPKPLAELLKYMHGLNRLGIDLEFDSFEEPLDSSNVGPQHWVEMAERIEARYDEYDGFVVLHGTDTLAYTASALAFMFENLAKPVVITGSQLPISDTRTDATANFVNSLCVAGHKATGLPCIPEVIVVFADKILRGCRTSKVSSSSWAGFDSPNFPPLGRIGEHIRIRRDLLRHMPDSGRRFQVNKDLTDRVMDIALFPGFKASHLEKVLLQLEDVDAVILETYGSGNAPNYPAFLESIEAINQEKKTIVNRTQCAEGMVEMGLYEASAGLLERGVISGLDMTREAALTKLMWTMANRMGPQITVQMQVSQRGEQSEDLFDLRYGKCGNKSEVKERYDNYCTPDRRFDVAKLSRAVVRISGLYLQGLKIGETTTLRIFMNLPTAKRDTPSDHTKCVVSRTVHWQGEPLSIVEVIDDSKARSSIGDGDITLSVIVDDKVSMCFEGLYLALFAQA